MGIDKKPDHIYVKSTSTTRTDVFWQTLCCSLITDLAAPQQNTSLCKRTNDSYGRPLFDAWWEWCKKYDCDPRKLSDIRSEFSHTETDVFGKVISLLINMRRLFVSEGDG